MRGRGARPHLPTWHFAPCSGRLSHPPRTAFPARPAPSRRVAPPGAGGPESSDELTTNVKGRRCATAGAVRPDAVAGVLDVASIFKPTYTKPIPDGAQIVQKAGKPHARFQRGGKTVLVPLTEDGSRLRLEGRKWWVEYRDAAGHLQRVAGFTDRKATEQLAAELERNAARGQVGMVDPYAEHARRPLREHLEDFCKDLAARDNTPRYVSLVAGRLASLLEGCGF